MHKTLAALTVFALSTASIPALAAPSADAVIAANRAAAGGDAWDRKDAVKVVFAYSGQGMTGTITSIDDLKNGCWMDDAAIGPATEVQGFDGMHAWDKDPSGSVTIQDGGDQRLAAVNEAYRRANRAWLPDHGGATVVSDGEKTEGGSTYDVLTITPKDGKKFDSWFDANTHLLARTVEMQSTQTITTTYSDYRTVDGMQVAYKNVVNNGDAKFDQTATVTSVTFLPPQNASVFAAPKVNLNDYTIAKGEKETTFPFRLINNHIYADVMVNGKGPYQFIFDTGGVNLVTPPLAAELGLKSEGDMQGNGAGAGHMDVSITKVSSLTLGDATVKDQVFMEMPLNTMSNIEGVPMPGMVGYETFRRFVTRIDYGAHTITLIRPDAFDPRTAGVAVPIKFNGNTIEAAAVYDGVPGTFTIDTGNRAALDLNTPFVASHAQFASYNKVPEAVTGWGVGGPTTSRVIRGHNLVLGGQTIAAPVVQLSTDTKGADADESMSGNIGGGVLKRFVVTLDYEHSTMYLRPAAAPVTDLDTFDRSGVWVNTIDTGYVVVNVTKDGPAEQAGLKVDDQIVAVDGKPATSLPVYELRERLRNKAPGTVVHFSVKRGSETKDVAVTLRDLI
jgi:membrane-associated protease RseP (regulator of RpoE activity)